MPGDHVSAAPLEQEGFRGRRATVIGACAGTADLLIGKLSHRRTAAIGHPRRARCDQDVTMSVAVGAEARMLLHVSSRRYTA